MHWLQSVHTLLSDFSSSQKEGTGSDLRINILFSGPATDCEAERAAVLGVKSIIPGKQEPFVAFAEINPCIA